MDCVVSPLDHVLPVAAEDVNVTLPPVQNDVAPLAEIVGVAGVGVTVITSAGEFADEHPPEVTNTV